MWPCQAPQSLSSPGLVKCLHTDSSMPAPRTSLGIHVLGKLQQGPASHTQSSSTDHEQHGSSLDEAPNLASEFASPLTFSVRDQESFRPQHSRQTCPTIHPNIHPESKVQGSQSLLQKTVSIVEKEIGHHDAHNRRHSISWGSTTLAGWR